MARLMLFFAALQLHSAERLRRSARWLLNLSPRLRFGVGEAQRTVRRRTALCGGKAARPSRLSTNSSRAFSKVALVSLLLMFSVATTTLRFPSTHAQEASPAPSPEVRIDSVAVHQALLDLTNPWTVMCVAAHPDDEDGTSLTVLRHKHGVHTVSLFSTYGEGGQNAVGPQLYEELGVIRARETMAAAEIQGSEPHFLGLKDFGFSKSADEAFRVWGHEEALRRMVLKIRELRPDVIITNHDTTSGHGHHQATGRLLLEAFEVAADPRRFSDQLKAAVQPWQVKRIFVRAGFGNNAAAQRTDGEKGLVAIDPNASDPVRGISYAEQALQALQKHETQGPWPKSIAAMARFRNSADGRLPLIRYRLTREAKDAAPLPQSAATFLDGLQLSENEAAKLVPPTIEESPLLDFESQPDRVLSALIAARKSGVFTSADGGNVARSGLMNQRMDKALALLSGVTLTLNADDSVLVPNTPTVFSISLADSGKLPLTVNKLSLRSWGGERQLEIADQLPAGTEAVKTIEILTPKNAGISVPSADHLYDGHLFGESLIANADVELDGARFSVNSETKLDVAPAVEIRSITPSPYVFTPQTSGQDIVLTVQVINHLSQTFRGSLAATGHHFFFSGGWGISDLAAGEMRDVKVSLRGEPSSFARNVYTSRTAPHVIDITIRQADTQEEVTRKALAGEYVNARVVKKLHVGFIPSFDQTLELSLMSLGVDAKKLSPGDVQNGDLKPYDTIIIDNRGYEAHPELIAANDRLLSYVNDGGTLIVFYHKNNEWNPDPGKKRPQLAPFPLTLGGERVTDENAVVSFLQPQHRLLNFPNKITASDFSGWVQERGLYYPKEWDAHYSALLAMNDEGEAALRGGLLVAPYGRGQYIYTSMVWYRELRAGVPGAYRMLANMISYGHR